MPLSADGWFDGTQVERPTRRPALPACAHPRLVEPPFEGYRPDFPIGNTIPWHPQNPNPPPTRRAPLRAAVGMSPERLRPELEDADRLACWSDRSQAPVSRPRALPAGGGAGPVFPVTDEAVQGAWQGQDQVAGRRPGPGHGLAAGPLTIEVRTDWFPGPEAPRRPGPEAVAWEYARSLVMEARVEWFSPQDGPRPAPQSPRSAADCWPPPDDMVSLGWRADGSGVLPRRSALPGPPGALPLGVVYVEAFPLCQQVAQVPPARRTSAPGDCAGAAEQIDFLAWRPEVGAPVRLPRPVITGDRQWPDGWMDPANVHAGLEYAPPGLPLRLRVLPRQANDQAHLAQAGIDGNLELLGRAWLVPTQVPLPVRGPVREGASGRTLDPSPVLDFPWPPPQVPLPRRTPFPAGLPGEANPLPVGLVVVTGPYYVVAADLYCPGAVAGEVSSP